MKYLVIAEKPSVSKSIAKVIGAYRQEDGYLEGGDCVVSWCLGHLAEYAAPEHYDERMRTGALKICQFSPQSGNCWYIIQRSRSSMFCANCSAARNLIMW